MPPALQLGVHLSSLEREGWDMEQCLAWASRIGIHYFEAGAEMLREYGNATSMRRLMDSHGMTCTALDVSLDAGEHLANSPGPDLEAQIQWAAEAACQEIVLTGLEMDHADTVCRRIAAMAERSGIAISVDLWDAVVCRAEELRNILERIDSKWIRVAIDTGHVISAGRDPLELAAIFEGSIGHFRIRTGSGKCGEPPLRSIIELLLDGDYHGGLGILDDGGRAQALASRVEEVHRTLRLTVANSMSVSERRRGRNV